MKKRFVFRNSCILITSVVISCYYYYCLLNTSIPFHSDDAGSTFALMDDRFFGGNGYLHRSLSIFALLERLCCSLFGYTEFATLLVFCIQYFIMFSLVALILINKEDTGEMVGYKLLYLTWFSGLLGVQGVAQIQISKFHTGPTIILLLALLIEKEIQDILKKRVIRIVLLVLALMQMDYVLSFLIVIIPIILLELKQIGLKRVIKIGMLFTIFLSGICAVLYVFFTIKGIPLVLALYGNRSFSSVQNIVDNISIFFEGLFGMFNCQIIGEQIIAVNFFPRFIKCVFICGGLVYTGWYLLKGGNNERFKELCCTAIAISILAFVMTGMQGDIISIRYCQCLLFFLPIIAWDMVVVLNKKIIDKKYMMAGFIILGVSQLVIKNPNTITYRYDLLAKALEDNNVSYAVAPYWSSNVVSIISEGNVLIQPCIIAGGELIESDISTLSLYSDKATVFNTIISGISKNESWDETTYGMTPESIAEIYGVPLRAIAVDDCHNVYIYNYDIRNIPCDFEKADDGSYFLTGNYLGIYELSIMNVEKELEFEIEGGSVLESHLENYCQKILLSCSERQEKLVITFKDTGICENDSMTIVLKAISEYLPIKIAGHLCNEGNPYLGEKNEKVYSEAILMSPGDYKLVLYGKGLEKCNVDMENLGIPIQLGQSGERRKTYYIQIEDPIETKFEILFEGDVQMTNFSLELR